MSLSERARHSYDVEEDEEEVEEKDAPASRVENGAAVKLVRHFAHTGVQSGDGSGTDSKHVVHCQAQRVRLASSGFVKCSLEATPGFQTERAFVPVWHGAGSGWAISVLPRACKSTELYSQGVKRPIVARLSCKVVHGLSVDTL